MDRLQPSVRLRWYFHSISVVVAVAVSTSTDSAYGRHDRRRHNDIGHRGRVSHQPCLIVGKQVRVNAFHKLVQCLTENGVRFD
jgi:hypothetical protein